MTAKLSKINEGEVLRYLGCAKAPDPELREKICRLSQELIAVAVPRLVWRRLPLSAENEFLLAGEDIRGILKDCSEVVLFAATLGTEAERFLQQMQIRDMTQAVILDACADSAIENVCDHFCEDLAALVQPYYLTDRYSPGYGDLPLSQQKVIFDVLDVTRRIGVTLTDSGLMLPQKSVTALIGISDKPQKHRSGSCMGCSMYMHCIYRKEGRTCDKH